ncbi:MAG: hypothetical protein RBT87_06660 [bacterium]|jgi:hypothetical protein|nr:hypothetical protein [bacterium]
MRYEVKKITKMIDEVLTFFIYSYNSCAKVDLICQEDGYRIGFDFPGLIISDEELNRIKKLLKAKRDPSLTNYYWQLTGEIEDDAELYLVALMADKIDIKKDETGVKLIIYRKKLE